MTVGWSQCDDDEETVIKRLMQYWYSQFPITRTPLGMQRLCRLPFGFSVSSSVFKKRVIKYLKAWSGLSTSQLIFKCMALGKVNKKLLLLTTGTSKPCYKDVWVQHCPQRRQAEAWTKKVQLMGHTLTSNGVKMDPEKGKAIQEMPKQEHVEPEQCRILNASCLYYHFVFSSCVFSVWYV